MSDMSAIECGRCLVKLPLLKQFTVQGVPTFMYHCTRCNGKVHLQIHRNPHTGEKYAKQVRLTGSLNEVRPESINPTAQLQIPVAYTLGSAPTAKHVQAAPIKAPPTAYTLGDQIPGGQLPPDHPMHPEQIRRRIQPIRW